MSIAGVLSSPRNPRATLVYSVQIEAFSLSGGMNKRIGYFGKAAENGDWTMKLNQNRQDWYTMAYLPF
jgi:hypothetical protein